MVVLSPYARHRIPSSRSHWAIGRARGLVLSPLFLATERPKSLALRDKDSPWRCFPHMPSTT